jgi:hypothetical protein
MKLTPEKLTAFCAVLAETCNVGKACVAIDVSRYTAYKWRKDMPEFAESWDDAMKAGVLGLEDEVHRRAFEGIDKPLTHQGQFTYLYREEKDADGNAILDEKTNMPRMTPVLDENGNHKVAAIREYSDTLSIFLLKAHAPDKYRENAHLKLSGSLAIDSMSEAEIRAELAALVASGVVPTAHDDDNDISGLV